MCARTAAGGEDWNPFVRILKKGELPPILAGRLPQTVVDSLGMRGCKLLDLNLLWNVAKEYKAEWVADNHIAWHEDWGWVEMLQYRPGVLASIVLKAQSECDFTLPPSFQKAVQHAIGWPTQKILGFQMGICNQLNYNPTGATDDEYLDGISLGWLFHQSQQAKLAREKKNGG